ncbi:sigma-70 family RNA polymerase sigma factor [Eubacteriales bacterium OttesenSCG-928-G02]|nr:sigma-70 family RNA polymerase sigma factor [Eubacteriales bacterium OttesenSCG-928-G02]
MDKNYFERMVNKYSATVYRIGLSYLKQKADAEDVMQEVFIRFLKKNPVFLCEEHEKAWFIRVCINRCKSFLMLPRFKNELPLEEQTLSNQQFCPDEDNGEVYNAVMALKPKQRICIHLFYYENYSISEISTLTSMNESTVKSHLRRGKEALKNILKGELDYEKI